MAAAGFCIGIDRRNTNRVRRWFRAHPQLPPNNLTVDSMTVPSGAASLKTLLQAMLASASRSFAVVSHGETRGFFWPLVPGGSISSLAPALDRLMQIADGAGTRAPGQIQDRDRTYLQLNDARIGELLQLMRRIRARRIDQLEFRSCIIGRELAVARSIRQFFGARRLGAPQLFNQFGEGSFTIAATPAARHRSSSWRVYRYDVHPGVVHACVKPQAASTPGLVKIDELAVYADSLRTAGLWVREYLAPNASYRSGGGIPLHMMFGRPPVGGDPLFADTPEPELAWPMTNLYKDRIRYVFG